MKETWRIEVQDLEQAECSLPSDGEAAQGGAGGRADETPPGPGQPETPPVNAVDDAGLRPKCEYLRDYYASRVEHDH